MIYKFLTPHHIFKQILSSYNRTFTEMFVTQSETEKYSYALLKDDSQIENFINHFGNEGIKLSSDSNEYPGSNETMKNKRVDNFIRIAAPNY